MLQRVQSEVNPDAEGLFSHWPQLIMWVQGKAPGLGGPSKLHKALDLGSGTK